MPELHVFLRKEEIDLLILGGYVEDEAGDFVTTGVGDALIRGLLKDAKVI